MSDERPATLLAATWPPPGEPAASLARAVILVVTAAALIGLAGFWRWPAQTGAALTLASVFGAPLGPIAAALGAAVWWLVRVVSFGGLADARSLAALAQSAGVIAGALVVATLAGRGWSRTATKLTLMTLAGHAASMIVAGIGLGIVYRPLNAVFLWIAPAVPSTALAIALGVATIWLGWRALRARRD